MRKSRKYNVGFIGCGRVANNHHHAVNKCSNAHLMMISDINEELAYDKAQKWQTNYCSPEEIINKQELDIIFILTPVVTHYDYAVKALEAGKHVLIEKPVSFKLNEIQDLINIARRTNKVCMPGHSYLYIPELRRFKNCLKNSKIGIPTYMFMSEIYLMPEEKLKKYHGPLKEVMCHEIYLMLAYLGEPVEIKAFSSCFREKLINTYEEQIMINAKFSEGTLAHLFVSWTGKDATSDPWTFKLKILGTDGGLNFSRRNVVNNTKNNSQKVNQLLYDEMFVKGVDYFINKCILKNKPPLSTMEDAFKTMEIVKKIENSSK